MKLKNKKTGEMIEFDAILPVKDVAGDSVAHLEYGSLAELNEEWEDVPEEPKRHWIIDTMNDIVEDFDVPMAFNESIGNYFETKEEAEKVVEKLKAWKRLKDKGFRFDGWEDLQAKMGIDDLLLFNRDVLDADNVIGFRMDNYHDCIKDLNTCFGGKE